MSRSSWLLLPVALFLSGCGGGGSGVSTVPVTGVVTLDGSPLPGATVSFSPQGGGGRAAVGTTDIDGKFSLMTVAPGDGAVPGSYGVAVTKKAIAAAAATGDARHSGGQMTPEQTQAMMDAVKGAKPVEAKSDLPERYASASSSGLTATVEARGTNNFTFELQSN